MRIVVLTGGTRGIGYGLADRFLALGCGVVISGRSLASVEEAAARLASKHETARVLGQVCDVTQHEQVQALWDAAKAHFGRVDIWINNAGISHPQTDCWEQPPEQMKAVIETNLLGVLYGVRVALSGMLAQGHGCLYSMEGLGSDGRRVDGLTLYGTTKSAVSYLTDALVQETRGTPLIVGALSPGMVVTNFLIG